MSLLRRIVTTTNLRRTQRGDHNVHFRRFSNNIRENRVLKESADKVTGGLYFIGAGITFIGGTITLSARSKNKSKAFDTI